jgi:predicted O-methyltransferase YrrM
LAPEPAPIDLTTPDPIPAILASSEYRQAVQIFAESSSIKDALVPPDSQAFLYCLIRLLRPKLAVEIGTYLASTTRAMARAIVDNGEGELHTIDPFAIRGRLRIATWSSDLRKATRFNLMNSMSYFAQIQKSGLRMGLVFVDGNHDYEFALFDIQCAARMMHPGGFIVIDNIAQPGPFMAARDFMERASVKGWHECGNSLARFRSTEPFDRQRTTIQNTDFCVLRAPAVITIGSEPVCFDNLAWTPTDRSLRLQVAFAMEGRLQIQFVMRVFELPPREIIESVYVDICGPGDIDIPVPFPASSEGLGRRRFSFLAWLTRLHQPHQLQRRSIEPWLTWEGPGKLHFREMPSLVSLRDLSLD